MKIQEAEKREPEKQYSEARSQESEEQDRGFRIQGSKDQGSGADGQAVEAEVRKNEGASGYVQENTGNGKSDLTTDCAVSTADAEFQPAWPVPAAKNIVAQKPALR